jgi:AraC-like DNA-binding protein
MPEALIESPGRLSGTAAVAGNDVLSSVLATIRLSGSLQFCFVPTGHWQTDPRSSMRRLLTRPGPIMPFHIVADGACWVRTLDREVALEAGDVVVFPFSTGHDLGGGEGTVFFNPTGDLPPRPWREIPVMRYGDGDTVVRLLCGYLQCDAMNFGPLRMALPELIHIKTRGLNDGDWLRATVRQMIAEVDDPRPGGVAMLPRLTEIIFIEILRHQMTAIEPGSVGLLAALADPGLSRCLSLIHADPGRDWSLEMLGTESGMSRSVLAERFQAMLGTSPMRYVRDWKLQLAGVTLSTTKLSIAAVAEETGYSTEAAFNRAFAKVFGTPPAAWRQSLAA